MNEDMIPCEVCRDLMPLVQDEVASEQSRRLVEAHLEGCAACRAAFAAAENDVSERGPDDGKIIGAIRRKLLLGGVVFLTLGALLGIYLSNSMGMFYNFIIMPCVGAVGLLVFQKRWFLVPLGVMAVTYLSLVCGCALGGNMGIREVFTIPIPLAVIYMALTGMGVLIAALLRFAFSKEEER